MAPPPSLFSRMSGVAGQLPGVVRDLVRKPSLLSLTAGVAGLSVIANAVAVAAPTAEQPAPASRLGASIQQSVRERDQAIADQKRGLDLREQALRASEARLKADLAQRQAEAAQSASSSGRGGAQGGDGNDSYDDLARIYQTMKPAKAAVIFERLDLDVQTEIARRMRERSTAMIVSNMTPNAAVQLSMALAGKRQLQPVVVEQQPQQPPARRPNGAAPRGLAAR
ncbi:magnesium transporter, mgtE intracellular region domain-containing protein [Sphingomonas sp. MM-1]|uniref:MotE family protein n=1 Tax=Sphingomonas sp. MM-1 TaxID=745310 RepID=UPI0002C05083|nr:magnesium transporter, mgtE intracellular region domain-containing protein [Sphingomonas sp. MM-1]AGH49087.1 magnesium transporter, mgtE intracellular region domain-containing protein [Sphingomonas sp. MM-1]